jgi:hypothetical protein
MQVMTIALLRFFYYSSCLPHSDITNRANGKRPAPASPEPRTRSFVETEGRKEGVVQQAASKPGKESEKQRLDRALDEGLEETFPGSDPVAVTVPATKAPEDSLEGGKSRPRKHEKRSS